MNLQPGSIPDLSLMTANVDIGLEAAGIFQCLAKGEVVEDSKHLLVAPKCLQKPDPCHDR